MTHRAPLSSSLPQTQSACWNLPHLPSPSPTGSQGSSGTSLSISCHPPKPSLKKQTETNKGLIPLLSWDPTPPPVPQHSPFPRGQASGSRCKERGPVRETVLGGSQGCQLGGEQTPPLPQGAPASMWAFRGSVSGSSGCLTNTRDPLEQQEFITSQPWRREVGGPGVGGPVSPEAPSRPGLLRLPCLPRVLTWSSLSVCLCPYLLIRTPVIWD